MPILAVETSFDKVGGVLLFAGVMLSVMGLVGDEPGCFLTGLGVILAGIALALLG